MYILFKEQCLLLLLSLKKINVLFSHKWRVCLISVITKQYKDMSYNKLSFTVLDITFGFLFDCRCSIYFTQGYIEPSVKNRIVIQKQKCL